MRTFIVSMSLLILYIVIEQGIVENVIPPTILMVLMAIGGITACWQDYTELMRK